MSRIRKEEYTSLGDFIRVSFIRDQAAIMQRFPRLDATFLENFTAKLEEVKVLESGLVQTEEQKSITARLYNEAGTLNKELNFLKIYIAEAGLETDSVISLKNDLVKNNIEGAVLKIESLKQFVNEHTSVLVAEGMAPTFANTLNGYKISLAEKNALQNTFMNSRIELTDTSKAQYEALYGFISKIATAGKLVFDHSITKNEYNLRIAISRMRTAKHSEKNAAA